MEKNSTMDKKEKIDSKKPNPNPLLSANPVSKFFFWWIKDLFYLGYKNDLEVTDLYDTMPCDESEKLGDKMERLWRNCREQSSTAKQTERSNLTKVIWQMFGLRYMLYGLVILVNSCVIRVSQPLLLAKLIQYFIPGSNIKKTEAYMYAMLLILAAVVSTSISHHVNLGLISIGMRVRVACCSLVNRKVLRLSKTALGQTTTGQVVNLLSNDVNRFDRAPWFLHFIWIMPIQTAVITYFIWQFVGVSSLVGVGTLFIESIPFQGYLGKLTSKLRLKTAIRTDERVRLMSEIISGIQVIKMYTWEIPFQKMVAAARKREIDIVKKAAYLRGFFYSAMVFTERMCLFLTLVTYILLGNSISAEKVFSLASYFNILQLTMAIFFPQAVQLLAESKVSIKRLEDFLSLSEIKEVPEITNNSKNVEQEVKEDGVAIHNMFAKWVPNPIVDTLSKINLDVKPGKLCTIIGPVGSGKSSLLQALLGELPVSSGSISISKNISYASQEPWLFVGTVRQNILFGQPYVQDKYKQVIRACALKHDFELLPNGDKTLIGDRGVSLSGGQRARINLARAVYRNADVYLFDDPLSAVDAHVGKHLFEECIHMYLTNKTRILVTHQLQHIKTADWIVILNNGMIEAQGTYNDLVSSKVNFAALLSSNNENEQDEEKGNMKELSPKKTSRQNSTTSSQNEDDYEDGKEPDEHAELISKGSLKASVYLEYFKTGGSTFLLVFAVVALLLGQIASSGADYWVTFWTNQEELRTHLKLQVDNSTSPESLLMPFDSFLPNATDFPLYTETTTEDSNISTSLPEELRSPDNVTVELNLRSEDVSEANIFDTDTCLYIYGGFIAGSVVLTLLRSIVFFNVCMTASIGLHNTMFGSILEGTMRFFDINPAGRVLNRFSKDMGVIDEILPVLMLECIQIFLVMFGILTMCAVVNYMLLVPMVLVGVAFYKIRSFYLCTAQDIKRLEGITRSPVFSDVSASMNGLTTIRAMRAQDMVQEEFDTHQDQHTSAWYLSISTMIAFGFWLDWLSSFFIMCVTLSFLVLGQETFGANVGLAISQSLILTGMLQYGIRVSAEVVSQMTAVERVLEYTKLEKEQGIESDPDKKPPATWPTKGSIEFHNLSLRYSAEESPVLKGLNFHIEPAQKVGIVGRTGAGKSSLIAALFRLTNLEGVIKIDGIDTKKIGLRDLRSRISIIPQEPVLFSSTLRNNLDPFHKYDDPALWNSLEEVELKSAVSGLEFVVNAGGSNFSAGQRQLVCLARAILRNNKILVLDEATANVDPQTDSLIQATIRKKFSDCTVLTIAHRLNTIMDSDRVIVMDAGKLVEFGHPYKLLQNTDGHFYKLVQETGKHMAEQLYKVAEEAYNVKNIGDS